MRAARRSAAVINYNEHPEDDTDKRTGKRKATAALARDPKPVACEGDLVSLPERASRKDTLLASDFHTEAIQHCMLPDDPTRPSSFDPHAWHARLLACLREERASAATAPPSVTDDTAHPVADAGRAHEQETVDKMTTEVAPKAEEQVDEGGRRAADGRSGRAGVRGRDRDRRGRAAGGRSRGGGLVRRGGGGLVRRLARQRGVGRRAHAGLSVEGGGERSGERSVRAPVPLLAYARHKDAQPDPRCVKPPEVAVVPRGRRAFHRRYGFVGATPPRGDAASRHGLPLERRNARLCKRSTGHAEHATRGNEEAAGCNEHVGGDERAHVPSSSTEEKVGVVADG